MSQLKCISASAVGTSAILVTDEPTTQWCNLFIKLLTGLSLEHFLTSLMGMSSSAYSFFLTASVPQKENDICIHHSFSFHGTAMFVNFKNRTYR